ncbi:FAD-dependent oxidoreductase [Deinococcus hopiensis]|uniref:FAD dependent oxidoreductase n=1 Tax=Deinococcus hopiensis KR-140 TaxID=695939 RepID=A0A1W1VDR8_9DEIO|nr:FAD-dependent oxidoreductase [Deinococcus hopiensis]SMB91466.1 FAD dependent oxidoreductase [Deinococcus hopiensis KR-140]
MTLSYVTAPRTWEVIVAGGGTAGAIAGIAAARAGARVLVVEALGSLGGTGTNAWVTPLMRNVSGGQNLNRGLTDELKARLHARGDGATDPGGNDNWFNPEGMKTVLEQMLLEAGGEVLYHTHVVATLAAEGTEPSANGHSFAGESERTHLSALILHNKGGLQAFCAGVIIDATGDADVAVRAGAPFHAGDEDGVHQAMSLRFSLAGVDTGQLAEFLNANGQGQSSPDFLHFWMVWGKKSSLEPLFREAVAAGVLEERDGDYFQGFSVPGRPGEISFNCPRIRADLNDGADPWHLSAAQTDGRAAIDRLTDFCRTFLPGCERAYIGTVAPMVGVRETRRVKGDYTLTLDDILDCRRFSDSICRNHYPVDIHSVKGGARLLHEREGTAPYFAPDAYHEIPYRALIPATLRNVLVPGRAASSTFEAQSAIRVQQNCHTMGEAAGIAAAWAARDHGADVRAVDVAALQREMRRWGGNV